MQVLRFVLKLNWLREKGKSQIIIFWSFICIFLSVEDAYPNKDHNVWNYAPISVADYFCISSTVKIILKKKVEKD